MNAANARSAVSGGWPSVALGYRYQVQLGKMLDEKRVTGNHLRPYLRNTDVQWDSVNVNDLPMMDFNPADRERYSLAKGDLLVCEGGEVGRAAIWSGELPECYYQKALHRLRPLNSASEHPRYMYYALVAAAASNAYADGGKSTIAHLPAEQFRRVRLPLPPRREQERIANFLDEKTAQIDALISEKERLLDTIQEFAHAEISKLLTAGGREGSLAATGRLVLPEAPAGWRVAALKRALHGMNQGWSPQCESRPAEGGEWGVLKVGCVNGTAFDASENKALPSEIEPDLSCVIRRGDVLVSRANTRELVGMAALVEDEYPNLLLCDKLYRLELRVDWVIPEFAVLVLRSEASRRQLELGATGASSSMQNISQDVLKELVIAFPPLDEQREIVRHATAVRQRTAALGMHARAHIDRLREYRTSLIAATVTGELDIKNIRVMA